MVIYIFPQCCHVYTLLMGVVKWHTINSMLISHTWEAKSGFYPGSFLLWTEILTVYSPHIDLKMNDRACSLFFVKAQKASDNFTLH